MARDLQTGQPFMKMHGLGNDFVVIDARGGAVSLSPSRMIALADRHRGVGFDQLAVIEAPDTSDNVDLRLRFFNADGSTSAACGNATRCIADHVMAETGAAALALLTDHGRLDAQRRPDGLCSVNMGAPQTDWAEIPLAHAMDSLHLPIEGDPAATGMGNPHLTFFVVDADAVPLESLGPELEHHPLFPQRTNVHWAALTAPDRLRLRVWERGVGPTLASGSSSCAAAVAACRRGLTGRHVDVVLDGGRIEIEWRDNGVWMTGATAHVFDGLLRPDWLEAHP